jgi:serine/threonine-protein kinase HipA
LRDAAGRDAVESLFRATVLNLIIGNGDAHAKNFSLLHTPTGSVRLAPLYDVMSSRIYGFPKFAKRINGEDRMERITPEHLLDEAGAWGIARPSAIAIVADLAQRVASAAEDASAEVRGVPERLRPLIDAQLAIFGAGLT